MAVGRRVSGRSTYPCLPGFVAGRAAADELAVEAIRQGLINGMTTFFDQDRIRSRSSSWSRRQLSPNSAVQSHTFPTVPNRAPCLVDNTSSKEMSSCRMNPAPGSRPSATSSTTAAAEAAVVQEIARQARPLISSG